jgi:hypothetical protein
MDPRGSAIHRAIYKLDFAQGFLVGKVEDVSLDVHFHALHFYQVGGIARLPVHIRGDAAITADPTNTMKINAGRLAD